MELTLEMLLYFIRNLNPRLVRTTKGQDSFVGVKQLFEGMEIEDDLAENNMQSYLYVCTLSELLILRTRLAKDVMVLAVEDCEFSKQELDVLPCGLILVSKEYKIPYLMNRMIDVFSILANWDKNMHIAALEGKTVQELLDISERILEYPVIIFDASFDVLAHTRHQSSTYDGFHQTIQNGYTDVKTMEQIKKKHIFSKLKRGEALVAPSAWDENQTNVYLCFFDKQTLLGYACIFPGDNTPKQGYLDILKYFSENMKFCLSRDYENHRYGQMMYETFLINMMNPAAMSKERVQEQIQNIDGLEEDGRFVLGILSFSGEETAHLGFLARMLEREMWNVKPFIYEGQICLLKALDTGKKQIRLSMNGKSAICSNCFKMKNFHLESAMCFITLWICDMHLFRQKQR
jgi:hypothetical protein